MMIQSSTSLFMPFSHFAISFSLLICVNFAFVVPWHSAWDLHINELPSLHTGIAEVDHGTGFGIPQARRQAVFVAISDTPDIILSGGYCGHPLCKMEFLNDTWILHTDHSIPKEQWEKLSAEMPEALAEHAGVVIATRQILLSFAGKYDTGANFRKDVHIFDYPTSTWRTSTAQKTGNTPTPRKATLTLPMPRSQANGFYTTTGQAAGGSMSGQLLYSFVMDRTGEERWEEPISTTGDIPTPRFSATGWISDYRVRCRAGGKSPQLWLFGGSGETGVYFAFRNDLYSLNLGTFEWTEFVGESFEVKSVYENSDGRPGGRCSVGAVQVEEGIALLYGGYGFSRAAGVADDAGLLGDLWLFRVAEANAGTFDGWQFVNVSFASDSMPSDSAGPDFKLPESAPNQRSSPGLAFVGGSLYLYGGNRLAALEIPTGEEFANYQDGEGSDLWSLDVASLQIEEQFCLLGGEIAGIVVGTLVVIFLAVVVVAIVVLLVLLLVVIPRLRKKDKGGDKRGEELEQQGFFFREGKSMTFRFPDAEIRINDELFEIDYSSLKIGERIGKGGSSTTIFRARYASKVVAFKCWSLEMFRISESYRQFEQEVALLGSLRFPHILSFFGATVSHPRIGIVMEFCPHGDLRNYIEKSGCAIPVRIRFLRETALAMKFLHSKNVIHRDLKPENVLISSDLEAKVCDFGLSKLVDDMSMEKTRGIGTSIYMAPEIFDETYSFEVDCFSFGVMLFTTISGEYRPYGNLARPEVRVARDPAFRPKIEEEDCWEGFDWAVRLMRKCWDHEASNRPTFNEICDVVAAEVD